MSSHSYSSHLLPTDRYGFSSRDGLVELKRDEFKLPSELWTWETDWEFEKNMSDGWEYATDFPANYYPSFFLTSCVRRKKWTRMRRFMACNKFIHVKYIDMIYTKL